MPGNYQQYETQVNEFNQKYGVEFSFAKYEDEVRRMNNYRSVYDIRDNIGPQNTVYRTAFLKLYREAIENRVNRKSNKDISPSEFIEEFDELIDGYRANCTEDGVFSAPETMGAWKDYSEISDAMKNSIRNITPG